MYAEDRRTIGEHYAIIEIKSDIATLERADKRYVNMTMTILDCKVDSFEAGQLFESFQMEVKQTAAIFDFENFT